MFFLPQSSITSLTDMISFWMGVFSPFPSVRIFCTYSALAVLFTYTWHVTFFAGCMAVFGYFEKRNLHGIFGCQVQPLSVAIKGTRRNVDNNVHVLKLVYVHESIIFFEKKITASKLRH